MMGVGCQISLDGLDYDDDLDIGPVSNEVRPLYRDIEIFTHRCVDFANTLRLLPTNQARRDSYHRQLRNVRSM